MTTVAVLAFGTTSAAAFAQDDPTSTPPAPTETTMTTPPPTSEPAPLPPAPEQVQQNSISGALYGDKNRNGRLDPGEAVQGEVSIFGGATHSRFRTTSDADGKFALQGLTPGTYWATYELKDGWVVHHAQATGDKIVVAPDATAEVTARAERPYSEQLRATASLDHDSYEYPAYATIKLNLTNTTDRRIEGIQAQCNRANVRHAFGNGGPEWHVFGSHGLTLEAGEQRAITIVENVTEYSLAAGVATLDCDFAPNVGWNTDGPSVHAEAKVTGRFGYTMVLGEDRNADQRIDADEVVSDTTVVLLDPRNGARVAERTSGADGRVEFTGLKSGDYQAVLLGSWAFTDDSQQHVRVTAQGGTGNRFLKRAAPASLSSTMKLDKPRYESHELVRADLTITNNGGQTAERVRVVDGFYDVVTTAAQWGDVRQDGPGVRIPAGESRTFSVTGKIRNFDGGKLTVWASVEYIGMPNDPASSNAEAEVVQTTGDVTGVVYVDRNHNRQQDPGEAAGDTVVEANGGAPYGYFRTTTDADGRYSFENIPSGDYLIGYTLAGGWVVHAESNTPEVRVVPGAPHQVTARAERPFTEVLKVAAVLDKAVYAVGDDVRITITLSNKALYAVGNIQAACNREGHSWPGSAAWGDLREPGVTLGPGETKTFVIAEKVPEEARLSSRVAVHCGFAPWVAWNDDDVVGYDWASVPGGSGTVRGSLSHDKNRNYWVDPGEILPNTRVRLMTDREYGGIVTETVSDAEGLLRFEQVPPGNYWAQVDGPWKIVGPGDGQVEVSAGADAFHMFLVEPGPPPAPPGGDSGHGGHQGGGGMGGALAKTGASVLGLGALAVLLVALGLGARVAGRRKV